MAAGEVVDTKTSAGVTGLTPRKSFGPMPTMVAVWPFTRIARLTTPGSAPIRSRQNRSLINTTGAPPGLSICGSNVRPRAASTPITEKYSGETRWPKVRWGVAFAAPPAEDWNDMLNGIGP